MKQLQFKKLFYWFAFLVLGFFSCYWTSESLYIWQPALGQAGSWLVAILFYVMASLSFSLVLNALSRSYDFYGKFLGRGASLFVGIIGLILFWLVCSMPTNTHTLLYNAEVRTVVSDDLQSTLKYLRALEKNNTAINQINAKYESKETEVNAIFVRMLAELKDPSNKGIGRRFRLLVAELNNTLSNINPNAGSGGSIQEVKDPGSTPAQWLATYYQYQTQANAILKIYRSVCDAEIKKIRESMGDDRLKKLIADCETATKENDSIDNVNHHIINAAIKDLTDAYTYIGSKSKYLTFDSKEDSINYCSENAQPKVKALQVVPTVWNDFIYTDRYNGHGFIWWVLISILVDIAGFIFFYLANSQKD